MSYDIIIPIAAADALFVKDEVLPYLLRNIVGAGKVYLITAARNKPLLGKLPERCMVVDEDKVVPGLTFAAVEAALADRYGEGVMPTGWYMQQLLKLGFAMSDLAGSHYLSWDADTIALRPVRMFDGNHPLMAMKKECHRPYFDTLRRLLGLEKAVDFSFISEHMLFDSSLVREMLAEIASSAVEGADWVHKIINATDYAEAGCKMMFSEFETYGTWCHVRHQGVYRYRRLSSMRRGAFYCGRKVNHRLMRLLAHHLDVISFERYDKQHFPHCVINWLLSF